MSNEERPRRPRPIPASCLLAGVAVAFIAGVALAGGAQASTTPTPARELARSVSALGAVSTYTLNGYINEDGGRVGLLVRSTGRGADAAGTFTSTSRRGVGFAGNVSFVRLGSTFYIRGNEAFWSSEAGTEISAATIAALAGQWVELPASSVKTVATTFGAFTDAPRLASTLFGSSSQRLSLGSVTTVHGRRVLALRGAHGVLYVAQAGAPLPVEITEAAGATTGSIVFGYPRSMTITAPPGAIRA